MIGPSCRQPRRRRRTHDRLAARPLRRDRGLGPALLQDYVVGPHVFGRAVGLSPLIVLVTVSAVGLLFGGVYVLLSVPLAAVLATLADVLILNRDPAKQEVPRILFPAKDARAEHLCVSGPCAWERWAHSRDSEEGWSAATARHPQRAWGPLAPPPGGRRVFMRWRRRDLYAPCEGRRGQAKTRVSELPDELMSRVREHPQRRRPATEARSASPDELGA